MRIGLSYLNARYYDGARGRFVGQDGVFWEIGQSGEGRVVLKNPQAQNSYSYAQNNPIVYKDPDGRIALGFGLNGSGNLPGMYSGTSVYAVLTMSRSPFNIEVGIISSGGGGLITGLASIDGSAGVLLSNARSISDLEGSDAVMGGSIKIGGTFGVDVGLSKNNGDRNIVTVNPTAGLGGVATPYGIPVELHGGGSYTKAIASKNITKGIKNGVSSVKSSIQKQVNNFVNLINKIQGKVESKKSKNNKTTPYGSN